MTKKKKVAPAPTVRSAWIIRLRELVANVKAGSPVGSGIVTR